MPNLPLSLKTSLDLPEVQIARLYWLRRRDGRNYKTTDWQLPVISVIAEPPEGEGSNIQHLFDPPQSPESSAIATSLGLEPISATITSYVTLEGVSVQDIELGLFQDSILNIYICDPSKPDSAMLIVSGYIAGAKNLGDEKFEMSFLSIEQKLKKNVNTTVTERCILRLGDTRCRIPPKSATATVSSITSPNEFIVNIPSNPSIELSNVWKFGSFHLDIQTYENGQPCTITTSGNVIKSFYQGGGLTAVTTLNSVKPKLIVGQRMTLVEGCGCTPEDCNARGNIINFHGFPDLPGVDKLITSAV